MLDQLTIFYTDNIAGDLALLPRLYTFVQALKRQFDPNPLLLDLGKSCVPQAWTCAATGGRSTLVVLDGMGYHAANIIDVLAPDERRKLNGVVSTAMIGETDAWRYHVPPVHDDGIIVSALPTPALRLCVLLTPAEKTRIDERVLHLQAVEKGVVGVVQVDLSGTPILTHQSVETLPSDTRATPSITASVDFVESEARYYRDQEG